MAENELVYNEHLYYFRNAIKPIIENPSDTPLYFNVYGSMGNEIIARRKSKKYPIYRIDNILSKTKYSNVKIINDGGWHFSQVKTPKDIQIKLLNGEQHAEFKKTGKNFEYIKGLVERKSIDYDHKARSEDYKYSKEFKLKTVPLNTMPLFLKNNVDKYSEWFDLE